MFRPTFLVAPLAVLAFASGQLAPAQVTAEVGDRPAYTFRSAPWNGQGTSSLADLRGRPVLVDFWGTRCPPCVGFAVPSALKLQAEYGDDLVVLLVECQGTSADAVASFALRQKWLGTDAMWTTERPFSLGLPGIPHSALISPEGEIVLAGYTTVIHQELEEAVARLVAATKQAPDGTPKSLHKAWKAFGKGDYADALAEAREVAEDEGNEDAALARDTIAEFQRRIDSKLARIQWQIENGFLVRALAQLDGLGKAFKGEEELSGRVDELTAKAKADERELDAAEALAKLEERLFEDGPDEKHARTLSKLAEKYAGTKTAARAQVLVAMIGRA